MGADRKAVLARLDTSGIDTAVLEKLAEIAEAVAAAKAASDPNKLLHAEYAAADFAVTFLAAWLGHVFARKWGAARASRAPLDPHVAQPDAVAAGRVTFNADALKDRQVMYEARNVLESALVLFAPLLPPGLALHMAVELNMLNLGATDTNLAKPTRHSGTPTRSTAPIFIDAKILQLIYYCHRYYKRSLPDAAAVVLKNDHDGKRWAALQKARGRHSGLLGLCRLAAGKGKEDRAAGRLPDPEFSSTYNILELLALKKRLK